MIKMTTPDTDACTEPEVDLDLKIDLTGLYDAECGIYPCAVPIRRIDRLRDLKHPEEAHRPAAC